MSAMMSGRLAALAIPILTARATRINAAHRNALAAGRSMLAYAVEAGLKLIEAKRGMPHGTFGAWCGANLVCDERTAQRYMKLAKSDTSVVFEGSYKSLL